MRFLLCVSLALALASVRAAGGQSSMLVRRFRESGGVFSLGVPAGWEATEKDGSVIVSRGKTYVFVSRFRSMQPPLYNVRSLADDFHAQFRDMRQIDAGRFVLGGFPATYALYTAISRENVPSLLRFAGVATGQDDVVVVIKAPQSEFNAASLTLQAIEGSITFSTRASGSGGGVSMLGRASPPASTDRPDAKPQPPDRAESSAPSLGIGLRAIEQGDLMDLGLRERRGVLVADVLPGGGGEQAGLEPGDVILSVEDQPVNRVADVPRIFASKRVGDGVTLAIARGGQTRSIHARLGISQRP